MRYRLTTGPMALLSGFLFFAPLLASGGEPMKSSGSSVPACGHKAAVIAYARGMIEKGRDAYGKEHTPLFAAALNRQTMTLGSVGEFGPVPGVREHDRSIGGSNPQEDMALYGILYRLTELTGDKQYAQEADKALAYFFLKAQSPATGLMAWGEHLYWDFTKEAAAWRDKYWDAHEILGEWPFWDACYRLAPKASWRFAIGLWDHQVADKKTGNFCRHAHWTKHAPGHDNDFPRYAGQMIVNWADAYGRKENQERPRRSELVEATTVVLARMEANMSKSKHGYLIAAESHSELVWPSSNLELARCLWKAAAMIAHDQPKLAERMRRLALRQDEDFFRAPHQIAKGGGFAATLDSRTGQPRQRTTNKPYTSVWATGYGHGTHADMANLCHTRYEQLKESHPELAARYRAMILAAANSYLSSDPDVTQLIKPGAIASVLNLLLNAFDLTAERKYLDRADHFGVLGRKLFLGDGLPLPRATNQHAHYEAITGGPDFMAALLRLHEAKKALDTAQRPTTTNVADSSPKKLDADFFRYPYERVFDYYIIKVWRELDKPVPAYTPEMVARHTALVGQLPWVSPTASADKHMILGRTPGWPKNPKAPDDPEIPSLPIYGYRITDSSRADQKIKMVLAAQNHPAEFTGSWVLEGMVNFLVGSDPRAVFLRKKAVFYVYPDVNPEGRYLAVHRIHLKALPDPNAGTDMRKRGNTELYAAGEADHNRVWETHGKFSTVDTLKAAMKKDTGGQVDYLWDMHGPQKPANWRSPRLAARTNAYANALLKREPETLRCGPPGDFKVGVADSLPGKLSLWAASEGGLRAAYPYVFEPGPWSQERLMEAGRNLALALYDVLSEKD